MMEHMLRKLRELDQLRKESSAIKKIGTRLSVRERLALLFEPGTFLEYGQYADHAGVAPSLQGKSLPADGVVTGSGSIAGRDAYCIAYDFSVLAGTMGRTGEQKCARLRDLVLKHKKPIIWLIDSAGARVQELGGSFFSTTGYLFREQANLSGVVPQVALILGPGAAGTAYIPALADVVIMLRGQSSLALGGPPLVEAALGEIISEQELGGATVHLFDSGVAHLGADSEKEAIALARRYLSFFPENASCMPPVLERPEPAIIDDSILNIVPENPGSPFDMHEIIKKIVDDSDALEIMPDYGRSLITALARFGGFPCGIVASQSLVAGGILENDSACKAARFITICDAFRIPLLFLQDVPGFMVGSYAERSGIIKDGAKMLYAVSRASVPKITIVIRKAYGAGYFVMCGRGYEPDYLAAWPTAEIALMGAEGAVNILHGRKLKNLPAEERTLEKSALEAEYRAEVSALKAAKFFGIDGIIDPRETARIVHRVLRTAWHKELERPFARHGIFPT